MSLTSFPLTGADVATGAMPALRLVQLLVRQVVQTAGVHHVLRYGRGLAAAAGAALAVGAAARTAAVAATAVGPRGRVEVAHQLGAARARRPVLALILDRLAQQVLESD